MIVNLNGGETPYKHCHALNERAWKHRTEVWSDTTAKKHTPHQVFTKSFIYTMPFLWLSGFFSGIGTILWFNSL